jgi:nitrite reductase (NADH) large subunit
VAKERVVIIGGGLAGASVVRAIRARADASTLKVDLLSTEAQGAYDRFDLPEVLDGRRRATDIIRYDAAWFASQAVQLHERTQARYIDRYRRQVHADELRLPYDKLVLATGSSAYLPSIQNLLLKDGQLHHGAFTFRTLADVSALDAALSTMRRVVVLGGGPLGLSLVAALRRRNAEVTLLHVGPRLMSGQLDEQGSRLLRRAVEALGATVHFGRRARALLGDGQLRGLSFHDGSELECDAVVLATGFQPDTWLGFQCGLSVERGIAVDGNLRSPDDSHVYALGECAQWRASIHGAPEQIAEQAEVIAEHVTQRHAERRYLGVRTVSRFRLAGLELASLGCPVSEDGDDVAQLYEPGRARYKKVVVRKGRLVSAILLGDLRQAVRLGRLYDSAAPLSADTQAQLFDLSLPASSDAEDDPSV